MKKEGTSAILSHCLYYKEGKFLPYREEGLSVLLFEGSLTGVASDLHLDPSLSALPWAGAAQSAGLEPGPHWAMITRARCLQLRQPSRLTSVPSSGIYTRQAQLRFLPLCGHHTLSLAILGVPATHAWAAWATGRRAWPQGEDGMLHVG